MTERLKPSIPFVNLHGHTTFSVFDAVGYPSDHMDFAYRNGADALAITDHGNMNALSYQVEHYKTMKAEGKNFKAVYGIEAYFIASLSDWKDAYAQAKLQKGQKGKKKDFSLSIEDEEESKKAKDLLRKRSHLILLAQNQTGLNNLFQLVSKSYEVENFYRYPRMDFEMLREHSEGVICATACLGGVFATDYWEHRGTGPEAVKTAMRKTASTFKEIFGDRFYGELQWNAVPEQHELNNFIIEVCKEQNIELISTADAHYYHPELWKDRELYRALGWMGKKTLADLPKSREDLPYELYPKNGDQMWESYQRYSKKVGAEYDDELIKQSLIRTHDIAFNKIEEFVPDNTIRLPGFVVPEEQNAVQALTESCLRGLREKGLDKREEYVTRLKEELGVIKDRGFAKYFLTMKAIADRASKEMAVGPGRGSAAGALTAYVLDITQIDPIKYGLLFSRFLRRDAKDYPDIDYDVSRPMELKEKLVREWGCDSVVPISNYNTLKLRSLIKDIAKFYGIPFTEVNNVTSKMLYEATPRAKMEHGIKAGVYNPTFEEVMKYSESLQSFLAKYPHVKTHVMTLHKQIRSISRHAGGIVVGEGLSKWMPLINSGGTIQTPWTEGQTVHHLEPFGFIKFDVLGLATLEMIEQTIKNVLKRHKNIAEPTFENVKAFYNENLHPDAIDLDDKAVFKNIFCKGKFAGVFQFTQKGAQEFCVRAKPQNIKEISNITAIYRPGPLGAGVDKLYIDAKKSPSSIKYVHPLVKDVLESTYGFLIYQEQIALLVHKLGKDISLDEGNTLRKLLTKKGTRAASKQKSAIKNKFLEGCAEKNISKNAAEKLWRTMANFAQYGFNLSHSMCYSIISYQCAWLLNYYPSEWMAAFLDKEPEGRKEKAINIAKSFGYHIEPLNINTSGTSWEIDVKDKNTLIQPLTSVKGLGEKAIEQIMSHRPFGTIEEFLFHEEIAYAKLNKKALDVLVRSQALNCLVDDRFTGLRHFWSCVAVDRARKEEKFKENVELYSPEGDFTDEEKIEHLASLTGFFPLGMVVNDRVSAKLQELHVPPISEYDPELRLCWGIVREVEVKKTKNGKNYYLVRLLDDSSQVTAVKCWGINPDKDRLHINRPYMLYPDYDENWGFSTRGATRRMWKLLG